MSCRCWLPYRHDADCERARAEARERARERAASDRLLTDLRRVYGDRVVEGLRHDTSGDAPWITEPMGSWEPRS